MLWRHLLGPIGRRDNVMWTRLQVRQRIAVLYLLHLVLITRRVIMSRYRLRLPTYHIRNDTYHACGKFSSLSVVLFPTPRRVSATLRLYAPLAYLFSL